MNQKDRSRPAISRIVCTAIALFLIYTGIGILPSSSGHRLPEASVYSNYVQSQVMTDGIITTAEWQNAAVVDLSTIPFNTVTAVLLAQNNDTMLHLAYDVISDTTQGANDSAGVAFDGDHDGAPTFQGDGEYSVRGGNDSACLPFRAVRCHYVYSGFGDTWMPEDAMDQGLLNHAGLSAAIGFGVSQRSAVPHRMYEFSIPLTLVGQPNKIVKAGDVIGFFASRHTSPYVGVWDADISGTGSWPANSPLGPNSYGHLYLAAPVGAALSPDYSFRPASISQPGVHRLTLRNIGQSPDSFDVVAGSGSGWTVELRDNLGTLLTDHGGNATLPDMGPLAPGATATIVATVSPLPTAPPGSVDTMVLEVRSWADPARTAASSLRSAVPLQAPWSDDFEGASPGWNIFANTVNDWESGVPDPSFVLGPTSAHSGVSLWGTNLAGNYSHSSFSILETPQIKIPDYVSGAHLTFWHWYRIIGGYGDGAWVEVSLDGGDWALISPVGGYPDQRFGGLPAYAGDGSTWRLADFNITSFAGRAVAFRFILWDFLANGVSAGWYLDDVAVQISFAAAGLRLLPTTGFRVGSRLDNLTIELRIQNVGSSEDVFDLSYSQLLGWNLSFLDQFGVPLDDTERPKDGFVDTGPVPSGGYVNVTLAVTIYGGANPGDTESITAVFRSSLDIGISASGQYRFQLAFPMPFLDNMESGSSGWVVESGSLWHQIDSCLPSPPPWFISYSPCHSWWYGQDIKGSYSTGARTYGNLTSPPIELYNVSAAHLSFRYWYETEPTIEYDQRWLIVKTDNDPWPKIGQAGSYQMGIYFEKTWLEASLDLSPFIGHIVQVRYYFDSIDEQNNDHQGWYVDDVNVSVYVPGSTPPNIALTRPVVGERWTGGVPQAISWQASDDSDPPSLLRVWINYSLTGSAPWSPIPGAQAVPGDSSPTSWTPPCQNITGVGLNATVADSYGLLSRTGPIKFDLDCRRPTVISSQPRNPPDVSVKANVSMTFSEPMNTTATRAAFSLKSLPGWSPIAGSFAWLGNTMYFVPSTDLAASTLFQVNLTTSAKDISRPGNTLASMFSWQFVTSSDSDSPPDIVINAPGGGEDWTGSTPGNRVYHTLLWTVTDDFDSQEQLKVWVNYTTDGGSMWTPVGTPQPYNGTMDRLAWEVPCVDSVQAAIRVDAVDNGMKWNSVNSPFFQIDCSPPTIISYDPKGNLGAPKSKIVIAFNETMNKPLTQDALEVWKTSDWTEVQGAFSWTGNVMTFAPIVNLARGYTYQVNVSTSAVDASSPGNRIQAALTWQFSITQVPPPLVDSTDPENGTQEVSVDLRTITIMFTPNTTAFLGAVNITPYVNFSMNSPSGSSVIIVTIYEKLMPGTRYTVRLNATLIIDNNGNHLDGNGDGAGWDDYEFSFTTASGPPESKDELPAWVWGVPLAAIGFLAPLAIYIWRNKRRDERRRTRREKKEPSVYRETIGPERRKEHKEETTEAEALSDSSLRPPF